MNKGIINKIIYFSSVDGPGNRTVIFLQSCNFECVWCHNPETINFCDNCGICVTNCPSSALSLAEETVLWNEKACIQCDNCLKVCPSKSSPKTMQLSVDELFEKIEQALVFTSGITISGGECTVQYEFLLELLKEAKRRNISAYIDTNGNLSTEKMSILAKYFDKAMLDIKSYNYSEHLNYTGAKLDKVLQNAEYLLKTNKIYEVRTVIVPELLNNIENVKKTSTLIARYNPKIRYKLIKFRPSGVLNSENMKQPDDMYIEKLKNIAEQSMCENVIIV